MRTVLRSGGCVAPVAIAAALAARSRPKSKSSGVISKSGTGQPAACTCSGRRSSIRFTVLCMISPRFLPIIEASESVHFRAMAGLTEHSVLSRDRHVLYQHMANCSASKRPQARLAWPQSDAFQGD